VKQSPLHALHSKAGAHLVPFAGYQMPLHYGGSIIREHLHTRAHASLFDVSHMGQIEVSGRHVKEELERLLPLDLDSLSLSHVAYTAFTNAQGGVIDDLLITRRNRDNFLLVVNAACQEKVVAHLEQHLQHSPIHVYDDHALLALQGPESLPALLKIFPDEIRHLSFMEGMLVKFQRIECFLSRTGYTGEDGFEISIVSHHAESLARALLAIAGVQWAGLGARDSLRLEAGLCLYGHELNEDTTPVEAGIGWSISRNRFTPGHAKCGGFPGSERILQQLQQGTAKQRVGLRVEGRTPVREGAVLHNAQQQAVGTVTSGTLSPTLDCPVAMGYVDAASTMPGTRLTTQVRDKTIALEVVPLPFVPHRYAR